jgi:AcrR family transcriptional regulator
MVARRSRLGRPPASSSAATRERILRAARELFAAGGYETTSNRALAEEAGLTTGAIYHYFDSKLDIYRAVHEAVQRRVYARFREAIAAEETFAGQLVAVLDTADDLNREDPSLARFLGASRVDMARDPKLRAALRGADDESRHRFFPDMIELGVRTGEIDPSDQPLVAAVIRTLMVGLVDAMSDDDEVHRVATDGIKALLDGKLVRPPPKG